MLEISAVIVTRGNVDLEPIMAGMPFDDVVIYDNSRRSEDKSVYGRYEGIHETKYDVIYVQDDDCVVPIGELVDLYEPNKIVCNMPANHGTYSDSALVGWGAIFDKGLQEPAFFRYIEFYPITERFWRTCDVVFTTLTPFERYDLGHESFDYAYGLDRMYHRPDHDEEREKTLEEARYVRDFPHPYWR